MAYTPDLAHGVVSDVSASRPIGSVQPMSLTPDGYLRVHARQEQNEQIWSAIVAADNPFVTSVNPWADERPSTATVNRPHAGETR